MTQVIVLLVGIGILNLGVMIYRSKRRSEAASAVEQERIDTVFRHDSLVRKLDNEQDEAARFVELRNKTFEMFELVRKNHENDDNEDIED
ncbi:MAG: hypothetical protein FWG88_04300 [Oscillospiraceae bacterium]|nr:hypothetical protein [Oscillospiraceae bacterium]